jgi:homoserine kinase type II
MPAVPMPTVEMLWEPSDPDRALADRFGFRDGVSAAGWVAAILHQHWGIRMESCDRIVISDRNALAWVMTSSERLLMKWSVAPDRFSRLSQIAQLTRWLHRQGLPVSPMVPSEEGALQVEIGAASMCL